MTLGDLLAEDLAEIKAILLQHRADGAAAPLLPLDVDLDGDGKTDAFGLDENDEVVVVSGVNLEHTVYRSDGDDVKGE